MNFITTNLALVTCREPLRIHISDNLDSLLEAQNSFNPELRKFIKDSVSNSNLDLACMIVKKIVIEKANEEVVEDEQVQQTIQLKRLNRKKDLRIQQFLQLIPQQIIQGVSPSEVYNQIQSNSKTFQPKTNQMENSLEQNIQVTETITPRKEQSIEIEKIMFFVNDMIR